TCRELFMVIGGHIWKQTRIERNTSGAKLRAIAERVFASYERGLATGPSETTPYSTDERHILNRWLARNSDHPALMTIGPDSAADVDAWAYLISAALSFSDSDLIFLDRDPIAVSDVEENIDDDQSAFTDGDGDA
ncbi:MAG: hypothetical protein WKF81_02265, partial [Thermomicrobiales bacterium]